MTGRKIINYRGVFSPRADVLGDLVRDEIKKGWEPFGNVYRDENNLFVQPMVKYDSRH